MLGTRQILSGRTTTDSSKYPALFLGSGKYAQGVSNSTLDSKTAFTIGHSFNYTDFTITGGSAPYLFSILKNNNSNIFIGNSTGGALIQPYDWDNYLLVCNGTSKSILGTTKTNVNKPSASRRLGTAIVTEFLTGDASSNTLTIHTIVASGMTYSATDPASYDNTVHTKEVESYTFTNWGTLGTDGFVTVGGFRESGESSTTANVSSKIGFLRAQFWDSVLTDQQILNTVGGDGTVFSMPSYTEGSYPQPNHEWKPVFGNNLTIPDTGSDTAIELTINGLAKVGYFLDRT